MSIRAILNRLEAAENGFTGSEFIAPLCGDHPVLVRIAGLVCRLKVTSPPGLDGLAVLKASSSSSAVYLRPASLGEASGYMALLPAIRLILLAALPGHAWLCLPADRNEQRLTIEGLPLLRLAEDGLERFETVIARFDQRQLWYEKRDPRRDPGLAAALRTHFNADPAGLPPAIEQLSIQGLSAMERQAYTLAREGLRQTNSTFEERRLTEALGHAGAQLTSLVEHGEVLVVQYSVDGQPHSSLVERDSLEVLSAGVCLSGEDRRFDLASLVGVLREGAHQQRLVFNQNDRFES